MDVTLDPNTAHPTLALSVDGNQVNHSDVDMTLPDNPDRFLTGIQSFSSGRFYYEVEVKGKTRWDLGVASVLANRKGLVTSSPEAKEWKWVHSSCRPWHLALAEVAASEGGGVCRLWGGFSLISWRWHCKYYLLLHWLRLQRQTLPFLQSLLQRRRCKLCLRTCLSQNLLWSWSWCYIKLSIDIVAIIILPL